MAADLRSGQMDELDDLERQLLLLKREEEHLNKGIHEEFVSKHLDPGVNATTVESFNPKPVFAPRPTYSTVDPAKGDVRGFKRARLIRRVGAVVALGLAVVAAATVASTGEVERGASNVLASINSEKLYESASSEVPEALESASNTLTYGQKVLFENRYEHLLDSERRHQEWDEERAAHLVRQISAASEQNSQVENVVYGAHVRFCS